MASDHKEAVLRDLAALRSRLARGEIDEEVFHRQRQLILEDLAPEERAGLGTPKPVTASGGIWLGPTAGAGGSAVHTALPSLSDLVFEPGTILMHQWRIVRELGRGGFGVVFEAEELHLEQRQAIKLLDPAMVARDELLARFRREVALMRRLIHPRIVRVYDYRQDLDRSQALISMELISGGSVKDLCALARQDGAAVPVALALKIMGQTLEALAAAHDLGVAHRDVTPGNILLAGGPASSLLVDTERNPEVHLVDFGIASLARKTELSQKSQVLGTAAYAAPEALNPSAGEHGTAADVYGSGAVTYELLTGDLPLGRFDEPSALRRDLPPPVNALILAMLERRPERRPTATAALAQCRQIERSIAEAKRAALERQRREAEAAAKRTAEERQRREAEAAKREAEERERRAAEERRRRDSLAAAKRAAEEQERHQAALAVAKRKAEEQERRDSTAAAKRPAEEPQRRNSIVAASERVAEERRRRDSLAAAKREAEEQERREAAAAVAKREAEEQERREAAAAVAKREAEEQERREPITAENHRRNALRLGCLLAGLGALLLIYSGQLRERRAHDEPKIAQSTVMEANQNAALAFPLEDQPPRYRLLVVAAREAHRQGQFLRARSYFERASEVSPLYMNDQALLADINLKLESLADEINLFDQGQYAAVIPGLWRKHEKDSDNLDVQRLLVDAYYNLALTDFQRGNAKSAAKKLREALDVQPDSLELQRLHLFAQTYTQRRQDLLYRIFVKYLPSR